MCKYQLLLNRSFQSYSSVTLFLFVNANPQPELVDILVLFGLVMFQSMRDKLSVRDRQCVVT